LIELSPQGVAVCVEVSELQVQVAELGSKGIRLVLELGDVAQGLVVPRSEFGVSAHLSQPNWYLVLLQQPVFLFQLLELILQKVIVLFVLSEAADFALQLSDDDLLLVCLDSQGSVILRLKESLPTYRWICY
jgi:hypothetical protein